MKEKWTGEQHTDSSAIRIELRITAEWINALLKEQAITIPLNDQYSLSNLKMELSEGKVSVEADIREKDNSSIRLDCVPVWHAKDQLFSVRDIELKTDTNNLLIKSAGWFANTFMSAKLDQKIAQALNTMFSVKKQELIMDGLDIPIPDGKGHVGLQSIKIKSLQFTSSGIAVNAIIDGKLKLVLGDRAISV
jgi:hypothetical protein